MDHFQLPRNPTVQLPKVPYVCSIPYDQGDFLTYPSRGGQQWHHHFASEWPFAFGMAEHINPSDDTLLEDFFQRWFFFGLLHAVLGQTGIDLYDAEDFIERDEAGVPLHVHTQNLAARLEAWAGRIESGAVDATDLRTTLQACLRLAYNTLSSIHDIGDSMPSKHPNFDQAIKCSIVDLCGTIAAFGDVYLGESPNESWNSLDGYATDIDAETVLRMKQNGWCERDIAMEDWKSHSASFAWYLKALGGVSSDLDHSTCSSHECKVETIHRDSYRPGHSKGCAGCPLIGPDPGEIERILNSDQMPVLQLTANGSGCISVDVVPFSPDTPYVALSHVWADGLGNPLSLTACRCQLERLQSYLNNLRGHTFRWYGGREFCETRKLYLWLDTLLVPSPIRPSSEAEKLDIHFISRPDVLRSWEIYGKAMGQMRDVYEKAAYVLVLDSALVSLSRADMDDTEAIIRFHASRWARRLWTLQEAAFADKLLIQFADQTIDYRDLALACRSAFQAPFTRRLNAPIVAKWMEMRSYKGLEHAGGMPLETLPFRMRLRRATEQQDQPLCAAALLGLDTFQVALGLGLPERMQIFWRLLSKSEGRTFPDHIIFNRMPRLTEAGYTWAPSVVATDGPVENHTLFVPKRSKAAELSSRGLVVSFPGIEVSACLPPFGVNTPIWQNLSTDVGLLHLRSPDGGWFTVSPIHPDQKKTGKTPWSLISGERSRKWHILLDGTDFEIHDNARFGLLGTIETRSSGPPLFQSRLLLGVVPFPPANRVVAETALTHASKILRGVNFRIYQILYMGKTLLDICTHFLPSSVCAYMRSIYIPRLTSVMERCLNRIAGRVSWHGQAANQSSETSAAMTRLALTGANPPQFLSTHIMMEMIGRRATITKWLGADTMWCVE